MQIMLRLAAQDRPAIPDLAALPGQPLPGIKEYIDLMKVCAHVICVSCQLCTEVSQLLLRCQHAKD